MGKMFCSVMGYLIVAFALCSCAVQQKNTVAASALPIRLDSLDVVFNRMTLMSKAADIDPSTVWVSSSTRGKSFPLVLARLETGVETRFVSAIKAAGIRASYSAIAASPNDLEKPPSLGAGHTLEVTPVNIRMTCATPGGCSPVLSVRLTLTSAGSTTPAWSTELEEPYMSSAFILQSRYDSFADELANAVLVAVAKK